MNDNTIILIAGIFILMAVLGLAEGLYKLGAWLYAKHQERKQMNRLLVKGSMCKMEKSA